MTTIEERRIDLLDGYLYAGDPYPTYAWLRAHTPVYRDETNQIWGISTHRDVMAVETDAVRYSNARGSRPRLEDTTSMINMDDPAHQQYRQLVSRQFTPRAVRRFEDRVRERTTELIDAVCEQGHCDVVADLAAPLPATLIGERLGYPTEQWASVVHWSATTMQLGGGPGYVTTAGMKAAEEFAMVTWQLIQERRAEPREDLISVWCHEEVGGRQMTDAEIISEALLLLDGGAETTRTVIGSATLALMERPEERAKLLAEPSLIGATAVEEFIRFVTPILNMRRTATVDHELQGQSIRAGDELLLMYSSANRDEAVFDDPERLDVTRRHNNHVAFGFGTHFCLGASLARLEVRVMFEELLARLPDMRLAAYADPRIQPSAFARGLKDLKVEFTPTARHGA